MPSMEEALNWSEILFDILFFALLQFCNIGDISRLTQTCKQARKLFNDPSFPPVFQLDTEIDIKNKSLNEETRPSSLE